ncbi:MAG: hypothetical protein ACI4FO_02150 [Acutalibacteraceae bacterium]
MDQSKRHFNINSDYRRDIKSFIRSIIALLMAVMLIFGSTFAWIEGSKDAKTNANECTVSAGAGLQFIEVSQGDIDNGVLTFGGTKNLQDCSSVDGRNIFIPTTGSIQTATPGAASTASLKFRSAVQSDITDKKYITKEFIIKSLESKDVNDGATSGVTKIFIDSSSTFSGGKAVRISLNFNDGSDPIVIAPALGMSDVSPRTVDAVTSINGAGTATTFQSRAYDISQYTYGHTPICELPHGESKRVTITLWLEGADADCTDTLMASSEIKMNLVLSTEDLNMRSVSFVDYTASNFVANNSANLYVVNSDDENDYVLMSKNGNTYSAKIRSSIKNVYFQRVTESETPGSYDSQNDWKDSSQQFDTTSNESVSYYAIGRGHSIDGRNYGYWVDSSCTGVVTVEFTWNGFQSTDGWPDIYIYNAGVYGDDSDIFLGKTWTDSQHGFEMQQKSGNIFTFTFPAIDGIKFIISNESKKYIFDANTSDQSGLALSIPDQNQNYTYQYSADK